MKTIAICSDRDAPEDRGSWSGTPANLIEALRRQGVEVIPIGPLGSLPRWLLQRWAGVTSRFGARTNWEVEPVALRYMGRCLVRALAGRQVDAVITMGWYPIIPAGAGSVPPIYYYGDAPMAKRLDHSPFWSNISRRTRRRAVAVEREALQTVAGAFMSSRWAVDGLVESGVIERGRVGQVPFGANVQDPGPIARPRPTTSIRLLSVGVQWKRKGLDIAVLTADRLRERGVACTLDVVGTDPPDSSWDRPWVNYHGFVDTGSADGRALLAGLYRDADLFLLPTQYDPFCIVLSEAHAYSLPVVVTAVNGITERIVDQGILVDPGATVDQFADAVVEACERYDALSAAARVVYQQEANWDQSAEQLLAQLAEMPR